MRWHDVRPPLRCPSLMIRRVSGTRLHVAESALLTYLPEGRWPLPIAALPRASIRIKTRGRS
jgi:hypothetical protein